jgi:hypothetical protein
MPKATYCTRQQGPTSNKHQQTQAARFVSLTGLVMSTVNTSMSGKRHVRISLQQRPLLSAISHADRHVDVWN